MSSEVARKSKRVRIEEVCEVTVGYVGPMAKEYVEDGIMFLRSQNIKPFLIDTADTKHISPEFNARLRKSILRMGDVVVVRTGYPGTAAAVPKELDGSNCADLVIFRPSKELNPHYLEALFNSKWGQKSVKGRLVGAAQQHFNITQARNLQVNLPPREAQDKASFILTRYQDAIQNNTKRISLANEIAELIYDEWFVKYKFPGHERVKLVKSELGQIPEGWEVRKLAEVVTLTKGLSYKTKNLVENGRVVLVNLGCINRGGGFRYEGLKRFEGEFKEKHRVAQGDIVIAVTDMTPKRDIIARVARIPRLGEATAIISMDLVKLNPKDGINRDWLYSLLRYSQFGSEIKEYANGVNVLHLGSEPIEEYQFVFPSDEIRRQYSDTVSAIYSQIDVLELKNQNLVLARNLLMPRLVAGDVDVKNVEIEDATVEA